MEVNFAMATIPRAAGATPALDGVESSVVTASDFGVAVRVSSDSDRTTLL